LTKLSRLQNIYNAMRFLIKTKNIVCEGVSPQNVFENPLTLFQK